MRTNVFYVAAVEKRFFLLFPAGYLVYAAAGIFIKRDIEFFNKFRVVRLYVEAVVFGVVFA